MFSDDNINLYKLSKASLMLEKKAKTTKSGIFQLLDGDKMLKRLIFPKNITRETTTHSKMLCEEQLAFVS
ncbi:hypothetical protein BY458DRAFT_501079 [Sporodiniella umbellata]|nr:hypothetical protein BY458DRAFT_501079 [Sporodiniella umbellata]